MDASYDGNKTSSLVDIEYLASVLKLAQFPLIGKEYGNSEQRRKAFIKEASKLYEKGNNMYKDKPYRLTTLDGDHIVVPVSALEELRRLPDAKTRLTTSYEQSIESKYTNGTKTDISGFVNRIVRADLTRSLNRINPRLAQEAERTVDSALGPCEDWTEAVIYEKLLRVVAIVSGRIFLGPDLCRREEYLNSSINYTVDLFRGVRKLKLWNDWLRPIGQYFTPELHTISEHRRKAKEFLQPIIRERRDMIREGKELPDDMLQWMIKDAEDYSLSDEDLAEAQLGVSLAAIHTTTMATTDILYELAIRPEIVEEIRGEVQDVLKENDGVIGTHALFQMKLLDSVMPRFRRYIDQPITLSDGTLLPAGSFIEAAHGSIISNPALYPDPETFNPYRFRDLRNASVPDPINYQTTEQYQFVTVTKENMGFGYGRHACPGRFFAANVMKLILARMLLIYDIRMPGGGKERYGPLIQGASRNPNPKYKIEIRRVKTVAGKD
ncbi:ent-kaurene oxidase [Pseudomassariella vexata]|uniref:Ent-kaurene oxidase n=1 Tax=Pseudomassariella vexata TaxID=1141098 RepID=A0A1Y2DQC5_9PEZI|nr:ent-kaurene oxidase [Pseudomassariella vexata]ORY61450.1 ent-kaurene oxidase [Pseudomassariella vexata]